MHPQGRRKAMLRTCGLLAIAALTLPGCQVEKVCQNGCRSPDQTMTSFLSAVQNDSTNGIQRFIPPDYTIDISQLSELQAAIGNQDISGFQLRTEQMGASYIYKITDTNSQYLGEYTVALYQDGCYVMAWGTPPDTATDGSSTEK